MTQVPGRCCRASDLPRQMAQQLQLLHEKVLIHPISNWVQNLQKIE